MNLYCDIVHSLLFLTCFIYCIVFCIVLYLLIILYCNWANSLFRLYFSLTCLKKTCSIEGRYHQTLLPSKNNHSCLQTAIIINGHHQIQFKFKIWNLYRIFRCYLCKLIRHPIKRRYTVKVMRYLTNRQTDLHTRFWTIEAIWIKMIEQINVLHNLHSWE